METVGVVIGTYGDLETWKPLAERAQASVRAQSYSPIVGVWDHDSISLQHARNRGAHSANTDWLIFLDADDELDPNYVTEMLTIAYEYDIIQPSTLGVYEDGTEDDKPVLIPEKPLGVANYLVIGSMVRASKFWEVGGFRDLPALEDWDLFRRMFFAGGKIGKAPKAIYRVHVRPDSRNTNLALHGQVYQQIVSGQ